MKPRDMTSDTRAPRSVAGLGSDRVELVRAASIRNQPMNAIQRPPKPAPEKYRQIPSRMNKNATI
jgi:hypothetical protein